MSGCFSAILPTFRSDKLRFAATDLGIFKASVLQATKHASPEKQLFALSRKVGFESDPNQKSAVLHLNRSTLVIDFGLVAFLVKLNNPFCTGFSVAVDFFVALLFNELISVIVERPNERVNARRRRLFCHRLCHNRPCRLHRRGHSHSLLPHKPACRVNK
jgi:hypothetical protein